MLAEVETTHVVEGLIVGETWLLSRTVCSSLPPPGYAGGIGVCFFEHAWLESYEYRGGGQR